jgi:LL-diaminopimelate aminotransferase
MTTIAHRVRSLPAYHFVQLEQMANAKQAAGVDIINMTVGNPDLPAPSAVVEQLVQAARNPSNYRYPEAFGSPLLLNAFANYLQRRFSVTVNPDTEMALLLGSKEGLVYLALALLDPGALSLIPDPGYTVYHAGTLLAGGIPVSLPLHAEQGWFPNLAQISLDVATDARVIWLNYPNNPTGAKASFQQLADLLAWAKKHDIIVVYDNAYADVYWGNEPPVSILQIPGALDNVVEFFSFSKTYNMAGFRVGVAVGQTDIIRALKAIKSNVDSGMFRAVQFAALAACELSDDWVAQRNRIYQQRSATLLEAFQSIGLEGHDPCAGLYLWLKLPAGINASDFVVRLLDETGIFITPGSNFGLGGEGYVRVSLTVADVQIEDAVRRLKKAQVL